MLQRWFDAAEFVRLAVEQRVQRSALVPSMSQMLLAQPLERRRPVRAAARRLWRRAAAAETLHELERRVPTAARLEGYGLTEASAASACRPSATGRASAAASASGRPADHAGVEVRHGDDGEICVRSGA